MLNSRPELPIPNAAAQTRIVSVARIRLDSWKSVRPFKEIFCDDIWEFESYMPSHAVGSLWRVVRQELAETIHLNETLGEPSARAIESIIGRNHLRLRS